MNADERRFFGSLGIAFYGDDFTGSTDALEFLARAGLRVVLFIEAPNSEQLASYGHLDALGVAGLTRSLDPEKMDTVLTRDFAAIKGLNPRHVHYKVCSTFDSSPSVGSIGHAIESGIAAFGGSFVPVIPAAPDLGRYCAFGNLFARMGIGSDGAIYRLDRHPSISRHPVTPMREADLTRHLGEQTRRRIQLFDILDLDARPEERSARLRGLIGGEGEIVLFDCLNESHLEALGALLEEAAGTQEGALFSVGSSGVEAALVKYWQRAGLLGEPPCFQSFAAMEPLLVLSGSASPVTGGQIDCALDCGFAEVAVETSLLADEQAAPGEERRVASEVIAHLQSGRSVIVHTVKGADDARMQRTRDAFARLGNSSEKIGTLLGRVARAAREQVAFERLVVAGGDSSSYAARAMGIESLEMSSNFVVGAPLCRARAPGSAIDGLEVNFKGGQVGDERYFVMARDGVGAPVT